MWWLERADLIKRGASGAHQLATYPRTADLWLKDRLHDKETKRSYRKPLDFTLKPVRRPDSNPLRPDLRIPIEEVPPFVEKDSTGFNPPSSWRERVQDVLASLQSKERPESAGSTPGWIKRALVTKPPGRAEGLRAPVSAIGAKLNKKSKGLRLWHEHVFNGDGQQVTGILLRHLEKDHVTTISDLELCKPISSFLRVAVPSEYGTAPRISPEEQETAIEKGGHGLFKDEIVHKNVLLESISRSNDPSQIKQEAAAHLCLGILYDNGQDYARAVENYKKFSELCKKMGDVKGEAMSYNFLGCSLQEDQDKKLKAEKIHKIGSMGELELSTEAIVQYERALEYHEKHAELAELEGKYRAYTNIGVLQSALGSFIEAARSHRKALKCATYMKRPEYQSVAVGNLAYLLLRRRKLGAARLCAKRYLQICEALKYEEGEARGHYILGHIFTQQKKYIEAAEEFRNAMKIAKSIKNTLLEYSSKVLIGVSKGKLEHGKLVELQQQQIHGCS